MNTPLNTPNGTTFNCIIFFVLTNMYGHPGEDTVERLKECGSKVYVTMECGRVRVSTGKEKD